MRLPDEFAPSLREAAERLVAEVGEAHPPGRPTPRQGGRNRCWRCHKPGPLVLHHVTPDEVVYVHASCHRRIHRAA